MKLNYYADYQTQTLQFGYIPMQKKIELVANYCNKLALQLSKREFAENQMNFANDILTPITFTIKNYTNQHIDVQDFQPSQVELSALTPSELALQMVELTLKISDLLQTRFAIAQNFEIQKGKISGIQEEDILKNSSNSEEQEGRKQNEQNLQNHILNSLEVFQKNDSGVSSQAEKIKKDFESNKKKQEQKLVTEMNKIKKKRRNISLNEFKMIAKKIYIEKAFRPTQSWCLNFLRRNGLKEYVNML